MGATVEDGDTGLTAAESVKLSSDRQSLIAARL